MISNILNFWNYSIKRQLVLGITFLTLGMFLTLSFVILEKQKVFLNESNINQSKNRTNSLAVNSASWLMSNDYIGLQEVVDSISSYKDEVHIMIVDL